MGTMGLLAAGQLDSKEVERGIKYLLKNNLDWNEEHFTAVGFPKVFYLKYHGYANYFPLLTIFKVKNLLTKNLNQFICLKNQKLVSLLDSKVKKEL